MKIPTQYQLIMAIRQFKAMWQWKARDLVANFGTWWPPGWWANLRQVQVVPPSDLILQLLNKVCCNVANIAIEITQVVDSRSVVPLAMLFSLFSSQKQLPQQIPSLKYIHHRCCRSCWSILSPGQMKETLLMWQSTITFSISFLCA